MVNCENCAAHWQAVVILNIFIVLFFLKRMFDLKRAEE